MNKPNFFIIGEPKCGTTLVCNYLSDHEDVFISPVKEPNYFCDDLKKESEEYNGNSIGFYYNNENDYLSLFNDSDNKSAIGESSIYYAYSSTAAKNIYNFNPDGKILFFIREPLSFLQSRHGQLLANGMGVYSDFLKDLKEENNRRKRENIPSGTKFPSQFFYSKFIKYAEQLQRYLDYFPKDQIKVIIFEDLKKDNQQTIDEITDFLGLKRMIIERKNINLRKEPKYPKLKAILCRNYKIKLWLHKFFPRSVRKKGEKFVNWLVSSKKVKAKELDNYTKKELMKDYKSEVEKINKLLNKKGFISKDLVKYWGYDKL